MQSKMRYTLAMSFAGLLGAACGGTTTTDAGVDSGTPSGFQQPTGTVAVSFVIDDTANKVYGDGELQWKGSMVWDNTTRMVTFDSAWGGPFAPLFDDGPWNAGGHEPLGATAGDHKWGITVFATPPATGTQDYGYGAIDALNGGWIWRGDNGKYTLTSGNLTAITAAPLTLLAFGTKDLRLTIDTTNLLRDAGIPMLSDGGIALLSDGGMPGPTILAPWDTSKITVKGSAWGWEEKPVTDAGATFTLSDYVGKGDLKHAGTLSAGDKPEWVFVFNGVEYKAGTAINQGVKAEISPTVGGAFSVVPVVTASNGNSSVVVP